MNAPTIALTVLLYVLATGARRQQPVKVDGATAGHHGPGRRERDEVATGVSADGSELLGAVDEQGGRVGATVMVASGPTITRTVAVPETVPLAARTVFANVPGCVPAVHSRRTTVPPLATTDQVGVMARTLPAASLATAVNCRVPLMSRVAVSGLTVMLDNAPAITATVADPRWSRWWPGQN